MKDSTKMKKRNWVSVLMAGLAVSLILLLAWLAVYKNVSVSATREMQGALEASFDLQEVSDPESPIGVAREYRLHIKDSLKQDGYLSFYTVHQYVEVFVDGELVYQLKPAEHAFIKTAGCNWIMIPLYREDAEKEIVVRLLPVYESVREREVAFLVGSALDVYKQRLRMDFPQLLFSGLAILTGLVYFALAFYPAYKHRGGRALAWLGVFAVALGLWRLNDTRFSPFLLPERPVLMYVTSIAALMVGIVPLLFSMQSRIPQRWNRIYQWYCGAVSIMGIAEVAAQVIWHVDLRQMLPLIHGMLAAGAVGWMVMLLSVRKEEKKKRSALILVGLLAAGVLADLLCYYRKGNSSGLLFSLLALLGCVIFTGGNMVIQYTKREKELADSRLTSMMSQIRPHFIYNTLGSIEQLCELQPEKAAELVHDFALYLRGNFRELDHPAPIRLSQEIQHTKHYVKIENVRFPDIQVDFQIESPDFMLPALSVQPLVENAIKHGLMPLPEGGRVFVHSFETKENFCVSVEDNGVGFDPETATDGLGLKNIRGRLEVMCGGKLEIQSAPGQGSSIRLAIPKENQI